MNSGLEKLDKALGITQKVFWIIVTIGSVAIGSAVTSYVTKIKADDADTRSEKNRDVLLNVAPLTKELKVRIEAIEKGANKSNVNQVLIIRDVEQIKEFMKEQSVRSKEQSKLAKDQTEMMGRVLRALNERD